MTREELWLAAIAGLDGVNPPDYPVWHYEDMLAAIYDAVTGADSPRPFPERSWHLDEFLYAVYCVAAGLADPGCPEPTCRLEQFWKGIHDGLVGDDDASVPSPVWRIEEFLSAVFTASAGWGERTLTGSIVSFIGRANTEILALTAAITPIQDLHGYDNPWPAGGGKNKFDTVVGEPTANKTLSANGEVGDSQSRSCTVGYTPISASTTYTLSFNSTMRNGVFFYDSSKEFISLLSWGETPRTFETPSNAAYVRFSFFEATPPTNLQLELGSFATTYAPYSNICPITGRTGANVYVSPTENVADATTYAVAFGDAGTVYGGTVDVVSGKMVVDHGIGTANASSSWGYSSGSKRFYVNQNDMVLNDANVAFDGVCDMFVPHSGGSAIADNSISYFGLSSRRVCFKHTESASVDDWVAFLGNRTITYTYPLATPLTYQLTPQQVAALVGQNYVWADTGDVTVTVKGAGVA